MAQPTEYRVFIACPGDLAEERAAVLDVIEEVNSTHGAPLGYRLRGVWYGKDAAAGLGRPQAVVNDFMQGNYELFVGLMWKRFGTPTDEFGSGTEEEYRIARQRCETKNFPLMFYFLQKPFMPATAADLAEVEKVLQFRQELQASQFTWDCRDLAFFRDRVRKDLCLWMNRLLKPSDFPLQQPVADDVAALRGLWDQMQPTLQAAFAIAYNENRRVGDGGVQTRDLFAALLRTSSEELRPLTEHIPSDALPAPTGGVVATDPYVVEEMPWLSHCVAASVKRLAAALPPGRLLTSADIFFDIARHGSGESVRLLRQHNITPEAIERIVRAEKLDLLQSSPSPSEPNHGTATE